MSAEQVVAAYAKELFIRSEAEIKRPVVLLSGERTNIYGVLEKHMRETALPPAERFWRAVRTQWTPQLDTWRPRVNGVQLKVLAGARLPESDEEWTALHAALTAVRQHLRPDTSVERLYAELRDFVGMVVDWWGNRKKAGEAAGLGVSGLMKRVASAGVMLAGCGMLPGMPATKKACLEYLPLTAGGAAGPAPAPPGSTTVYQNTIYAAPEIVPHHLLAGSGSGRLPDRVGLSPAGADIGAAAAAAAAAAAQVPPHTFQELHDGSHHGGSGYLAALNSGGQDPALLGALYADGGAAAAAAGVAASPRSDGHHGAGLLPQLDGAPQPGVFYHPASPRGDPREGSADNREAVRSGASSADGKVFVTLNVGGHRFLTTAATLGAQDGSYFAKLAAQAVAAAGKGKSGSEFFVDRSGKIFEYVLDYLRSQRFCDSPSTLPRDERTLSLLAREADFYQLPELAARARAALAGLATAAAVGGQPGAVGQQPAEETPSDVPANIVAAAAEGSAHGGQLLAGRFGGGAATPAPPPAQQVDAVFVETGFSEAAELGGAQAALLQQLNATLAARQAEGFAVVSYECGTEREGSRRNLHYHVLLRRTAPPGA